MRIMIKLLFRQKFEQRSFMTVTSYNTGRQNTVAVSLIIEHSNESVREIRLKKYSNQNRSTGKKTFHLTECSGSRILKVKFRDSEC
jgi:hypothetical protein